VGKGIVYYTHNCLEEPIFSAVQKKLLEAELPITSISLKPIDFGDNIVLLREPGIITMTEQILAGLEAMREDVVFFAEHDVLYHKSHFDFTPTEDIFYYNTNVWRWDYPFDRLITYDHLKSLSGLCARRELLVGHYRKRVELIREKGWEDTSREPLWSRKIGHEPGKNRSILSEKSEEWKSEYPNIDIRHKGTITRRKCRLADFIHEPTNWKEATIEDIPGWKLAYLFPVVQRCSLSTP